MGGNGGYLAMWETWPGEDTFLCHFGGYDSEVVGWLVSGRAALRRDWSLRCGISENGR